MPSARALARLMATGRDTLSNSETIAIAIEQSIPHLAAARDMIAAFHTMIRKGRSFA